MDKILKSFTDLILTVFKFVRIVIEKTKCFSRCPSDSEEVKKFKGVGE